MANNAKPHMHYFVNEKDCACGMRFQDWTGLPLVVDPVNHPPHYTNDPSGVECITVTRHRNFNVGNAIKYLWRAGLKDDAKTVEDLRKAIWYIKDEIKRLGGEP